MQLLVTVATMLTLALAQAPPLTKAEQFQEAARKGDAATVKKLLDEGVDVNTKFRYGATALFYASDHGHLEVVKVLLDKGADMGVKDTFYGFTPLALATGPAQKKKPEHTEIAKLLIQKGAPGKEVAMTAAIQSDDAGLAKVILESGLQPAHLTDALEMAKSRNKTEMVTLLEQAGATPYQDFKIDPAMLAKLVGTYKGPTGNQLTIAPAGTRITVGAAAAPPAQRLTFVATGDMAFKAIGPPIVLTIQVEGDKIAGFTLNQRPNIVTVYTRVEDK